MPAAVTTREIEAGIFELNYVDPETRSRLTLDAVQQILAAFDTLREEKRLRVLMLTGTPEIFCAGGAESYLEQLGAALREDVSMAVAQKFYPTAAMMSFPFPTLAVMQGHAIGGGLVLGLCCDMAFASESSRYGVNFVELGFTPAAGVMDILPALAGPNFAMEMILTAKAYKGKELQGRGLFNHIVPAADVYPLALDTARRIAEKPRLVLQMCKEAIVQKRRDAAAQSLSREVVMHAVSFRERRG